MKPYFPSTGVEVMIFYGLWCDLCQGEKEYRTSGNDKAGCPVLAKAASFEEEPVEWIITDDGKAKCTSFQPN